MQSDSSPRLNRFWSKRVAHSAPSLGAGPAAAIGCGSVDPTSHPSCARCSERRAASSGRGWGAPFPEQVGPVPVLRERPPNGLPLTAAEPATPAFRNAGNKFRLDPPECKTIRPKGTGAMLLRGACEPQPSPAPKAQHAHATHPRQQRPCGQREHPPNRHPQTRGSPPSKPLLLSPPTRPPTDTLNS